MNNLKRPRTVLCLCVLLILCGWSSLPTDAQETDAVISVAWSPDGKMIAGAGENGFLRIWDAATGNTLIDFPNLTGKVYSVAWSPDSSKIASAGEDKLIHIWDAVTGLSIVVLEGHHDAILSVAWSPDGSKLASVSFDEALTLRTWDVLTYVPIATLRAGELQAVAWKPDSTKIAALNINQGALVLDFDLNIVLQNLLDYHVGPYTRTSTVDSGSSLAWRPDGNAIVVGTFDGQIFTWDVRSDQQLAILKGHTSPVSALTWSPDGTEIASAGSDGTIKFWNATTGSLLSNFQKDSVLTLSISFSPDGTQLAYGGTDGTLHIIPAPSVETATPTLREVFNASGCIVSCWEHIQPDVTTTDELESLLEERDIDYILNPMGDGQYQYLWLPENLPYIDTRDNFYEVGVTVVDDVVAEIYIPVNITLSQIVQEYGAPTLANESVSHNGIRDMEIVYPSFGLYFEITSLYGLDSAWVVHVVGENTLPDIFADVPSNIQDCSIYSSTGCLLATATPIPVQTATPIP